MKIILDTKDKTVTEVPDENEELDEVQLEAAIADLLITTMIGQAVRHYRKEWTRRDYIRGLCHFALARLNGAEVKEGGKDGD